MLSACSSEPKKAVEAEPVAASTPAPVAAEPKTPEPVETKAAPAPTEGDTEKLDRIVKLLASNSVYFDFDKAIIKPEYVDTIKKNFEAFQAMPDSAILKLEGNCDERGSSEYNLALGQKRADAVRRALVALGVADARIETISFGKEKPRCPEHNEQCWWQNRRTDFNAK
jgi:peptidoglycan-associated lipoprotein